MGPKAKGKRDGRRRHPPGSACANPPLGRQDVKMGRLSEVPAMDTAVAKVKASYGCPVFQ